MHNVLIKKVNSFFFSFFYETGRVIQEYPFTFWHGFKFMFLILKKRHLFFFLVANNLCCEFDSFLSTVKEQEEKTFAKRIRRRRRRGQQRDQRKVEELLKISFKSSGRLGSNPRDSCITSLKTFTQEDPGMQIDGKITWSSTVHID